MEALSHRRIKYRDVQRTLEPPWLKLAAPHPVSLSEAAPFPISLYGAENTLNSCKQLAVVIGWCPCPAVMRLHVDGHGIIGIGIDDMCASCDRQILVPIPMLLF